MCVAYKSQSEGLWRLAMDNGQFLKGSDYVTTTQLHMEFQCLFDAYGSTLSEPPDLRLFETLLLNSSNSDSKKHSLTHNVSQLVKQPTTIMYFSTRLNSHFIVKRNVREYAHPVFFPLVALCEKQTHLSNSYKLMTLLRDPEIHPKIKELSNFNTIIRSPSGITGQNIMNEYNQRVRQSYKSNLRQLTNIPRDPFFGKMIELIQTMPGLELPLPVTPSNSIIQDKIVLHSIIDLYSKYMKYFFTTGPDPSVHVCTLHMPVPLATVSSVIPFPIYKRQLRFLREGLLFDLYYTVYTMPEESGYSGTFKTILNLLPSPSSPGSLGLNAQYISAGIYVYKPFEYNGRFIFKDKEGKYSFLGDFLTHMWPLEDIHEGGSSTVSPPISYSSLVAQTISSFSAASNAPAPASFAALNSPAPASFAALNSPAPASFVALNSPAPASFAAALEAPPPPWAEASSTGAFTPGTLFGGPWRTSSPFRGGKTQKRKHRQTKKR